MNNLSRALLVIFIVLTVIVMLIACVTGPVAKPGLYVNKENRFTVEYPANFQSKPPMYKYEVFFAGGLGGGLPTMTVIIADKMKFEDAPDVIVEGLKDYNLSDIKILSKKHTKLADGTPAYEFSASSSFSGIKHKAYYYTFVLVVIKGEKMIGVTTTSDKELSEDLKKIPYSLKFY